MSSTASAAAQNRVIRAFVSSTFRDMSDERDELGRRVFLQLRKLCEQRGAVWGEVDLRWGITEEQKLEGKVLPICLEEIQRCRPYFIGLLGERYGWIPFVTTQEHYNLLEREAEKELLPFCREMNVGLFPYFVLANGLLAGRYKQGSPPPADSRAAEFERTRKYLAKYATPENYSIIDKLTDFAREREHTLADLAIAWVLAEPAVATVLAGASSDEQMAANARAASWMLSVEEATEIRSILEGGE